MEKVYYFHTKPSHKKHRITVAGIIDGSTLRLGVAACSPRDNFSRRIGREIASGRARKRPYDVIDIENITLDLKEMLITIANKTQDRLAARTQFGVRNRILVKN